MQTASYDMYLLTVNCRNVRQFCIVIACCFLCSAAAFSQEYHFRKYDVMDGLPGSLIFRIEEEQNGKLLVTTTTGASSFDGTTFKAYDRNDGLTDNGLFHLQKDSKEKCFWFISTRDRLFKFKHGVFTLVCPEQKFCWMDIDPISGEKWLMNRNGDVFRLDGEKAVLFLSLKLPARLKEQITSKYCAFTFLALGNGAFIIGAVDRFYYMSKSGQLKLPIKASYMNTLKYPRIFWKKGGDILLTGDDGLFQFSLKTFRVNSVFLLKKHEIFTYYEDKTTGDGWIGTTSGVFRFPGGIITNGNSISIISSSMITAIFKDNEDTYWFGTVDNGLLSCNIKAVHYKMPAFDATFLARDKNLVYAFSRSGNFACIEDGKVRKLDLDLGILGGNKWITEVITFDNNKGAIVVAGIDAGLVSNKKMTPYKGLMYYRFGNKPFYWKDGWMHYGNMDKIVLSREEQKTIDRHYPLWGAASLGYIDEKNSRFYYNLRANGELYQVTRKGKEFSYIHYSLGHSITTITGMCDDSIIIIATDGKGVGVLRNDSISWITREQGLLSDYCADVVADKEYLWVCTNAGLSRLTLSGEGVIKTISNYTADNTLLSNDTKTVLPLKDDIYVATPAGISCFSRNYSVPSAGYRCFVEKLEVNNRDTMVRSGYVFPYDRNNLTITLSQSSKQLHNNTIYYKYLLSPSNETPVAIRSNILNLASVEPGSYKLSVWSRNLNGSWSAQPALFDFTISPPYWKTWWFRLILAGMGGMIAVGIVYAYQRRQRRRAEVARKLVESDLRSLRLHMNPHFIFNSLTSLQSFIVTHKTEKAEEYISRFSEMIRSVMGYSISGEITIREEVQLLTKYIELELVRFEDQFAYEVTVGENIEAEMMIIPSLLIQPIVENAIKHGLTGMERKGSLKVHFEMKESYLYCTVEDNGRGRSDTIFMFNKVSGHVSTGVKFTEERIRLLLKDDHREPITIVDLVEHNKPAGTRVVILIPVLE